ncbi:hypothetical protein GOV11_01845 [Candidatus Woesearchaeota archaeon]|nr:hypothetical protein [Candidatus Woesearchaeota archaeon]
MVVQEQGSWFSSANKHIHSCEDLLALAALTGQRRFIPHILTHAAEAIRIAHDSLGSARVSSSEDALSSLKDIEKILIKYRSASTVFMRGEKLVTADESFSDLQATDIKDAEKFVIMAKKFVFDAGKHVVLEVTN